MQDLALLLLAAAWLLGTWLRAYQQSRFYQIEEYMGGRYLNWLRRTPRHLAPRRPLIAWFVGSIISILMAEAPGSALPPVIALIATLVAIVPQPEAQVKKQLVRTGRVMRIIGAAAVCSLLVTVAANWLMWITAPSAATVSRTLVANAIGFVTFALAPAWLIFGNLLMSPFETFQRRRFLTRAQDVLATINPKIIGITGSYGKTTTKVFLNEILNLQFNSYATPKSYNTLMGISLAINRDLAEDFRTEYFICEMGAYIRGEIKRICRLTPPDIAIITEIGPQHLERFGSLENVKHAKYEIIENLASHGVAVFNWDNKYIRDMIALGYPDTRLTVSRYLDLESARQENVTWIARDIEESLAGLRFEVLNVETGDQARVTTSIIGEHNVTNLLLCIAVAFHEGIPLRDIALRISTLQPAESRLVRQTTAAGITIINDAYSANPLGVVSALKVLGMHQDGKRLLITPGMIELGELQYIENRNLGGLAAQYATDIILIGHEQTAAIGEGIRDATFDMTRVHTVETLAESVAWYQNNLRAGDTVLFLNDLPDTY